MRPGDDDQQINYRQSLFNVTIGAYNELVRTYIFSSILEKFDSENFG